MHCNIIRGVYLLSIENPPFMKFTDIFKDTNDINEKSIVGFASFIILVILSAIDITFACLGRPLVVNQFIHEAFIWITLGSFGISAGEHIYSSNRKRERKYDNYNDRNDYYDELG